MIGYPKFKINDKVKFNIYTEENKEIELTGEIYIVDKWGIFFDESEVYYDIMANFNNERTLFKHIIETNVRKV